MIHLRAATLEDAQTATDLVIADDLASIGEPDYSLEELLGEWGDPGFELAKDAVIAEDADGTAIGCGHFRRGDVVVVVDARREGEGAGTAILEWALTRAKERGETMLRQGIGSTSTSARELLERHGFEPVRQYYRLTRDVGPEDVEPEGLRALNPDDGPAVFALYEAAFSPRPDYTPRPYEAWVVREFGSHAFDPALSRVIDGKGFVLTRRWEDGAAYVPLLGVHPDHGGQGLGTKLLRASFAAAAAAGFQRVVLNVASDNPSALHLYERVGMNQRWRIDDYQRALPN